MLQPSDDAHGGQSTPKNWGWGFEGPSDRVPRSWHASGGGKPLDSGWGAHCTDDERRKVTRFSGFNFPTREAPASSAQTLLAFIVKSTRSQTKPDSILHDSASGVARYFGGVLISRPIQTKKHQPAKVSFCGPATEPTSKTLRPATGKKLCRGRHDGSNCTDAAIFVQAGRFHLGGQKPCKQGDIESRQDSKQTDSCVLDSHPGYHPCLSRRHFESKEVATTEA